jgi:hypothetical protein
MRHHIIVTVQGGVAEVCEDTVPSGCVVEIPDIGNLAGDAEGEASYWSPELKEYWMKNHKDWGRCGQRCPFSDEL